ncbi:MAG: CPBP family intramembrane metalloprotease [Planctomycetes bacterium]|nr:CPBP family intramembrane metalloprotease [Planctomycetota bacterium]
MDPPFQPQSGDSLQPGADWPTLNTPRRGHAIIAWIGIVLACVVAVLMHQIPDPALTSVDGDDPIGVVQARYLVGLGQWFKNDREALDKLYKQAQRPLNVGSIGQRQRFVILAAELAGTEEAGRVLRELDADLADPPRGDLPELTEAQADVQTLLHALYGADERGDEHDAAPIRLTDDQRELLVQHLGWFGRLALAPPEAEEQADRKAVLAPAWRVLLLLLVVVVLGVLAGFAGFIGLVVTGVLTIVGKVRSGLVAGAGPHAIYAETFAIWMFVFFGLQVAAGFVVTASGMQAHQLAIAAAAVLVSLGVLLWPVLRGIPWRQIRTDIGWTLGRRPVLEPAFGVAGYAMTLPLLAVGLVFVIVLMMIQTALAGPVPTFAPMGGPAHPIITDLAQGHWWAKAQVLFMAVVAAPIVEETMFRGVLYRHLRDASARMGIVLSIALSTFINTFVFAVIHPQGWVAMPALMALACGFTLMREWRGTVVPSMIMHAINNAVVMTFFMLLIAD